MYKKIEKQKMNSIREAAQKKSSVNRDTGFTDNRSEAVTEKKMQTLINKDISPPVIISSTESANPFDLSQDTNHPVQMQLDANAFIDDVRLINSHINRFLTSSLSPTINAIDNYEESGSLKDFVAIKRARAKIPLKKQRKYKTPLDNLDYEIRQEEVRFWTNNLLDFLLESIIKLDVYDKRFLLDDLNIQEVLRQRHQGESTVIMGALLKGSLRYNKPPESDFYTTFIANNQDGKLEDENTANCWEFLLYAAKLAGSLDLEQIQSYHNNNGMEGRTSYETLGFDQSTNSKYPDNGVPEVGDIVFMIDRDRAYRGPNHVMMSLGGNRLISHNSGGRREEVEITTFEKTNQFGIMDFYFCRPPWG